jgi:hypothetical protein
LCRHAFLVSQYEPGVFGCLIGKVGIPDDNELTGPNLPGEASKLARVVFQLFELRG